MLMGSKALPCRGSPSSTQKKAKKNKKQNMYADFQKPSRLRELKTLPMFEGLTDKTICPHPQLIYLTWTK
jgi:hypothetical protein